ncbi:MAG: hypothetical protein KJ749_15110, partial [Planctomycetes bacterium]|nr:hypothetical protein [Planctomycetota bacterium]
MTDQDSSCGPPTQHAPRQCCSARPYILTIAIVISATVGLGILLTPRPDSLSARLRCVRNLQAIAKAMRIYGDQFSTQGTSSLDWLVKKGVLTPDELNPASPGTWAL